MIHTLSYTTTKVHSIKHNISRTLHPLNTLLIHCNKNQDNIQQPFIHVHNVSIMNDTHLLVIHNNTTTNKVHSIKHNISRTLHPLNTLLIHCNKNQDTSNNLSYIHTCIHNEWYTPSCHTQQLKYTQPIRYSQSPHNIIIHTVIDLFEYILK